MTEWLPDLLWTCGRCAICERPAGEKNSGKTKGLWLWSEKLKTTANVMEQVHEHLELTHHVQDRTSHLWQLMTPVSCHGWHVHTPVQRVQPLWINCCDVHPEVVLQVVTSKQSQQTDQIISTNSFVWDRFTSSNNKHWAVAEINPQCCKVE